MIDDYARLIELQKRRPVYWEEVPDFLRLDPPRAVRIYAHAGHAPLQRAQDAVKAYSNNRACVCATNSHMRYWGYQFFEKCKRKVRRGHSACTMHEKLIRRKSRLQRIGQRIMDEYYETLCAQFDHAPRPVIGDLDPDRIEMEWAAVMDREMQQHVEKQR